MKLEDFTKALENKYTNTSASVKVLNEDLKESCKLNEGWYIDDDCVINENTDEVDAKFTINLQGSDLFFSIYPERTLSEEEKKLITKKVKSELKWHARTGSFGRCPGGIGVYGGFKD